MLSFSNHLLCTLGYLELVYGSCVLYAVSEKFQVWSFLQVLERVVEDISFHAPERAGDTYTVDKEVSYVVFIWPLWHVLWYLSIFSS
jgi:hypothetical protein